MSFRFPDWCRSTPLVLSLASGTISPNELLGQDPGRPDTTRLPTVEVTRTRSRRPLADQPLAFTQIPRTAFTGTSGYALDEILRFVPGVFAQSRSGTSDIRLVIRGYGARGSGDRSNSGTSRGVRILVDGFPETEPDGRTSFDGIDLNSARSIDVIRSNASSVWGNAAGGVVNVYTDAPLDHPYGTVESAVGGFGMRRLNGRLGTRLGEQSRLHSAVSRTTFDGWRGHSSSERTLASASVVTEFGAGTSLGVYAYGVSHRFLIPGPLTQAQVNENPRQANPFYAARGERRFNRLGRLGVRVTHRLSPRLDINSMVFVSPKFLQRSERGTFRDFTRYHVGGNAVITWEEPFGFDLGALTAGVDEAYQDGAILFYSLSPTNGRGDTLRTNKREAANNFGAFVQQEITVGRWGLTVGARYDDITYTSEDFLSKGFSDTKSFTGVTPKIGLTFEPGVGQTLYATLGGGVEAPAGNETNPVSTFGQDTLFAINPLLEPIRSTTLEAGYRRVALMGSAILSLDLAAYRTTVRNEIIPFRGGQFTLSAGRVRRIGAEVGAQLLVGNFRGNLALTFSHNRYQEYLVDSVHFGRPGSVADFSDNTVIGVPAATFAVGAGYRVPALGNLETKATLYGASHYFADDANRVTVPSWRAVDLTVGLPAALSLGGGLGVRGALTVSNLFDANYLGSAFLNPDVVNGVPVAFEPAAPRRLLVSFSIGQFGDGE